MHTIQEFESKSLKNRINITRNKSSILFLVLGGFFITNALIAEFMGVKIFSLERTLGQDPISFSLLGESGLAFNLSAGVLLWPVVFILTDVINEYYGRRGVRFLTYLTLGLIGYAFLMYYMAINLPPADFWTSAHFSGIEDEAERAAVQEKVGNYDYAFRLVFGQGLWIIIASMTAFLIGQITDVIVFHRIKKWTGEKKIWLRATGSTLISQFIDTFTVLFIAFYIGASWSLATVLAICIFQYSYKFLVAVCMTPIIYLAHHWIDRYLGKDMAERMKKQAAISSVAPLFSFKKRESLERHFVK
ncbi:MAG: queuosine precursor transporter [Bacteroidota bacterium]